MRIDSGKFRSVLFVAAAAAAVVLGGCTTGPEIRRDTHPQAEFATYKTFGYMSPLATDRPGYESMFTARLKDATRRAMESRGYVYSATGPDLLINFFANVQEREDLRITPTGGYYGYRRGLYAGIGTTTVETVTYREGTLTVDLVEARRRILVWQATAEGTVSDEARKNPGPTIDALVTNMLAPLPAARP